MNQRKAVTNYFDPAVQAVIFCRKTREVAIWGLLVCALCQFFIECTLLNTTCVLMVASVSAVTFHFIFRGSVFRTAPLPTLVVLGFNISTMTGALFAQTFSLRSLVFNLKVPEITFSLCAIFQISLLVTHIIYLNTPSSISFGRIVNKKLFFRSGIMSKPTPLQIWIIGLVGSLAMLWGASNSVQYGDVGGKFIDGFSFLAFAPFLLPILDNIYPSSTFAQKSKSQMWLLIGYILFLIFVAIVRNSRAAFMMGITNLAVCCFLLLLLGQLRLTKRLKKSLMIIALVALIVLPVAADLAIAMVVVRGERTELTSHELVKKTIVVFNDKPALENYRKFANVILNGADYEEYYLSNPFVARFVSTKFFDNTLSYVDVRSGRRSNMIWSITVDKIIAILPTPLIKFMAIDVKKNDLDFSMGDALYNAQNGGGLGGFKTGSSIAHGFSIFGFYVFVLIIPIFLIAFAVMQSLTITGGSIVIISPVLLLQLMSVFSMAAGDSLLSPIIFVLRSLPQSIFIYWIVVQISRRCNDLLKGPF